MTFLSQTVIKLTEAIAPAFYDLYWDIEEEKHTHYWLKGGRGSMKSSFISIMLILKIMDDANKGIMSNGLVIRRVKDTLKESVFEQLVWAINKLGVQDEWHIPESMLKLTYKPTKQVILFRGMDKPKKVKSTKVSKGWIKYLWYEEADEIEAPEKIRTVNQSLMRGGPGFLVFYSFNPPKSNRNWTNEEMIIERPDKIVHHSTYLTAPVEWLGEQFLIEAEHLKKVNETGYKHEYLGEVVGTGGAIFSNITIRKITDDEISIFDKVNRAVDFGYAVDPCSYGVNYFDSTRKRLYIFYEYYKVGASNSTLANEIKKENNSNSLVIGDSAEPRTINELRNLGINITGAKKGPDSVEHGVKFLQDLEEIIIDPVRCPNTAREFLGYEYELDKEGNFKAKYPDKDNHSIDMIRYSLETYIRKNKVKVINKNSIF